MIGMSLKVIGSLYFLTFKQTIPTPMLELGLHPKEMPVGSGRQAVRVRWLVMGLCW